MVAPDLPKDVIIDIILQLPVKSIVRLRSLSKYWYGLLKSESFIKTHLLSEWRKSVLLVRRCLVDEDVDDYVDDVDVVSFHDPDSPELNEVSDQNYMSISPLFKDFKDYLQDPQYCNGRPYYPGVNLLGPCDGIVCFYIDYLIMLCNPALREFKLLPKCPFQSCYYDINGHGFGTTTTTKDFKVVLLQYVNYDYSYISNIPRRMVYVYSLSTNSWKQIDDPIGKDLPFYHTPMSNAHLFFNGACHWTIHGYPSMLCFDLTTEGFRFLEYPPDHNEDYWCSNLMIVDECLGVVMHNNRTSMDIIDIWVMKKYGVRESWMKLYKGMIGSTTRKNLFITPFCAWKNEWVLIDSSIENQLVSYSFKTNQIKKYCKLRGQKRTVKALIYQESLISLIDS